jgi:hypothetical protein
MSSVGGGLAVAVAAVTVAAVGKAARRYHRGEEIKTSIPVPERRSRYHERMHWEIKIS